MRTNKHRRFEVSYEERNSQSQKVEFQTETRKLAVIKQNENKEWKIDEIDHLKTFHDIKSRYTQLTDDETYTIVNQFTFNDFILHSSVEKSHPYEECTLEKAFLSKYTYKQICEMITERVWAERGESGKVFQIKTNLNP